MGFLGLRPRVNRSAAKVGYFLRLRSQISAAIEVRASYRRVELIACSYAPGVSQLESLVEATDADGSIHYEFHLSKLVLAHSSIWSDN